MCVCIFWKYTKRNLLHFMSIVWRGWETANSDSCREINFYCFSFSLMHFSTRPVFSFALTNSHIRICMPHAKCPITSFNNMHAYVKWTIIFESHGRTDRPTHATPSFRAFISHLVGSYRTLQNDGALVCLFVSAKGGVYWSLRQHKLCKSMFTYLETSVQFNHMSPSVRVPDLL